ncbi:hypothetical protein K25_01735 [Klebsiella pneumoniae]|nr:hypothetical protein HMPREF9538_00013 [Klebsiella sp. MS 92-3]ESB02552.1 hypothetical protein HMPREF1619_01277 [Klebsiella pneumoniae 909957]KTG70741.1 hypothetical protein K25_01735 [Klebsiella pneumoniae]
MISLVTDKVFLPFVQDRDADAYALCNFTRGSTSVTELPDGLRPLFRAEAFVSWGLNQASMAGRNCHSSMSAAMQPVMTSQRRMNRSGSGRL